MEQPAPTSVPLLVDRLRTSSRPALLWYSADGERVELSGRVLDNWAAKTANLWVDELDLRAGDVVALGDEAHWRSLAVALGTWTMGAGVRTVDPALPGGEPGDRAVVGLVNTDGTLPALLERAPAEARVVLLERPALSLGHRGELPAGDALDYCAEIRSHADVYAGFDEPDPADAALWAADAAEPLTHGELLSSATALTEDRERSWGAAAAVHVPGRRMDAGFLLRALAVLAGGRAVVVTDRDPDDPQWGSVLESENAVAF